MRKYRRNELLGMFQMGSEEECRGIPEELVEENDREPVASRVFSESLETFICPKHSSVLPLPCPSPESLSYPLSLLHSRSSIGDPFSQILLEHGSLQGDSVQIQPFTRPLERIWYIDYKGCSDGPFSTVDMFTWSLLGCLDRKMRVTWTGKKAVMTLEELVDWRRWMS